MLKFQVVVLEVVNRAILNFNYLIVDPASRKAVIVDPAWEMHKIDKAIANAQASLEGVLITHAHPDHLNLAEVVAEKYTCPIWMSQEEISESGFSSQYLQSIDETPFYVGQMCIQPILTPGHTSGSICYLIEDNIFTGDVLFAEGCGVCPDFQGAYTMFNSLNKLKKSLTPLTRIYPGHTYGKYPGQPFYKVNEENIYLQFDNIENFASFRMRSRKR